MPQYLGVYRILCAGLLRNRVQLVYRAADACKQILRILYAAFNRFELARHVNGGRQLVKSTFDVGKFLVGFFSGADYLLAVCYELSELVHRRRFRALACRAALVAIVVQPVGKTFNLVLKPLRGFRKPHLVAKFSYLVIAASVVVIGVGKPLNRLLDFGNFVKHLVELFVLEIVEHSVGTVCAGLAVIVIIVHRKFSLYLRQYRLVVRNGSVTIYGLRAVALGAFAKYRRLVHSPANHLGKHIVAHLVLVERNGQAIQLLLKLFRRLRTVDVFQVFTHCNNLRFLSFDLAYRSGGIILAAHYRALLFFSQRDALQLVQPVHYAAQLLARGARRQIHRSRNVFDGLCRRLYGLVIYIIYKRRGGLCSRQRVYSSPCPCGIDFAAFRVIERSLFGNSLFRDYAASRFDER